MTNQWKSVVGLRFAWRTLVTFSAVFALSGCAAGRTDDGSILIGAKVAELPETMEQAAKLAAGMLPEPWSTLAKAGCWTAVWRQRGCVRRSPRQAARRPGMG